jgi:hypothetical protein
VSNTPQLLTAWRKRNIWAWPSVGGRKKSQTDQKEPRSCLGQAKELPWQEKETPLVWSGRFRVSKSIAHKGSAKIWDQRQVSPSLHWTLWDHRSMWTCGIQIEATSKNVCYPQCVPCIPIEEVCSFANRGHNRTSVEIEPDLSYQEHPSKVLDWKERSTRARSIKMYKIQWSNHFEDFLRSNYPDCLPKEIGT